MKRLCFVVAALVCLSMLQPLPAYAAVTASGACGDAVMWSLAGDTLTISGKGAMEAYSSRSPAPWDGQPFSKVVIQEGVSHIGDYAFYACDNLTSVAIPDSVTSIGEAAFAWCTRLLVTIPEQVTDIGAYAFSGCYCLTSVTISDQVTHIGACAFSACYKLTSISVRSGNEQYSSVDGILFNKDQTVLLCCPEGWKTGFYRVPEGVVSIGAYAFAYNSGLTGVAIPSSVTDIAESAFSNCNYLTSVTIPDGVATIGDSAFAWCDSLLYVAVPDSVTQIGAHAFKGSYNVTLCGRTGAYIERYATDQNIPFATLHYTAGNVNGLGDVTASDALLALQAATGKAILTDAQTTAADVDGKEGVTANDALLILQYATQKITVFPAA